MAWEGKTGRRKRRCLSLRLRYSASATQDPPRLNYAPWKRSYVLIVDSESAGRPISALHVPSPSPIFYACKKSPFSAFLSRDMNQNLVGRSSSTGSSMSSAGGVTNVLPKGLLFRLFFAELKVF